MKTKTILLLLIVQSFFVSFCFGAEEETDFYQVAIDALMAKDHSALQGLLEDEVDPNVSGEHMLLLTLAVKEQNLEAIDLLLEDGADPCMVDKKGRSPILHAIREHVDLLGSFDSQECAEDEDSLTWYEFFFGRSPKVGCRPDITVLEKLLEGVHKSSRRAHPEHRALMHQVVLAFLSEGGIPEDIVDLLDQYDINMNPLNSDRRTPLDVAWDNCFSFGAMEVMQEYGARNSHQYRKKLPIRECDCDKKEL